MINNKDFDSTLYEFEEENDDDDFSEDLDLDQFSQTVVYGADWTVETLKNQIKKETIFLEPIFQRRDAWDVRRKSKLIESLILGIPVPSIVLAEEKITKRLLVLDGKQRLLSIFQFFGEGDPDLPDKGFKLQGLDFLKQLNGETYQSLNNNENHIQFLRSYENQTIRTISLRNWPNEAFLHKTFLRLNQGGKQLLGQELRLALHPGGFMRFIDEKSRNIPNFSKIFKSYPDPRMADSELILRFLAFHFNMNSYSGGLKFFLDKTSATLSTEWEQDQSFQDKVKDLLNQFEESLQVGLEIFDGNFSRIYDIKSNKYQQRLNKAVFDIFIHSFLQPEIRKAVREQSEVVKEVYENLFQDQDFKNAVEQATRTKEAVETRFRKWERVLEQTLQMKVNLPKVSD